VRQVGNIRSVQERQAVLISLLPSKLLESVQLDLMNQIAGSVKPEIIERKVFKNE